MNLSDRDLERLLREACPPIDPSPSLRARVLAMATPRSVAARRILRIVLPYAAGIVSALAAQHVIASSSDRPAGSDPAAPFSSIADRPPAPPAPAAAPAAAPAPASQMVASAPVPRIS